MSNPPASKLAASAHSSGELGETPSLEKRPGRIRRKFRSLAAAGELGLIAYITAGDLSLEASAKIVVAAAEAGADIIELGVPFSDPVADGPVIQRASERALKHGTCLAQVLTLAADIRQHAQSTGLIVFSYLNPILRMGTEQFCTIARHAGVDGVLVTDLPVEEADKHLQAMKANDLAPV